MNIQLKILAAYPFLKYPNIGQKFQPPIQFHKIPIICSKLIKMYSSLDRYHVKNFTIIGREKKKMFILVKRKHFYYHVETSIKSVPLSLLA